jgi:hypothetical protein
MPLMPSRSAALALLTSTAAKLLSENSNAVVVKIFLNMLNSLVWHHPNGDAILIQLRIEQQMYILQFKVSASNALKAI